LEISFNHIEELLSNLIRNPSFSKQEAAAADVLESFFKIQGLKTNRKDNNVWVLNKYFDPAKETILLNSHHDTVRPGSDWTRDPFIPIIEDDKLYGLGSNDAGAALVSLIAVFLHYYDAQNLDFNLIMLASAEEEISGLNGVESVIGSLGKIDFGIIGEPTGMQMAIAEKGLMVLDCLAEGTSGHAAKESGINAIYIALEDIKWLRNYRFPLTSDVLGPIKMTATMIESGSQHNVIPDTCKFVVDVRNTDSFSNEEVLQIIKDNMKSQVIARSTRLQPSAISGDHVLVKTAKNLGIKTFGSDTLSDQALMNFPTVKMGPGDSLRSHTADEYIKLNEIQKGIEIYIQVLDKIICS
jgi:acetylornithine deacetylase